MLRYFEEEIRTTPKIHALIAIPYVRTELQLRFAWCMIGLTRGEYNSEERKRSKVEKVFLMTSVRDLMTQEGAAVACVKQRDAKKSKKTRAHLEAMVLRTKPEANRWLHLTPRIAALGADAFERGPAIIRKTHAYLVKEVNLAKNAEEKSAEFVNRVCQVTLEAFWTQNVKGEEGFDRTDSILEGLGAGWTASFLAKIYPSLSRYLIKRIPPSSRRSIDC